MTIAPRLRLDTPRRVSVPTLALRGVPRERAAVRIRLRDGDGFVGLGEAVPLPGYSRDDVATAEGVLAAIAGDLVPPDAGGGPADLIDATLAPHDGVLAVSPSARFALECALVDLIARRAALPAAAWLAAGRKLRRVPVSLLLPDDEPVAAVAPAVAAGFEVLKLKVARADRTEAEEHSLLAAIRAAADSAGTGARLRLDANGALPLAQVADRLAAWQCHGIELVEEPVAGHDLLDLPALPLRWAADESLADPTLPAALLALPVARRPAAWVLKPALLGLARCIRLAEQAGANGIGVIVTHSLDGDLGHAAACALAAALPRPPWPCGLAPHPGLTRPRPASPWLDEPVAPGLGIAE